MSSTRGVDAGAKVRTVLLAAIALVVGMVATAMALTVTPGAEDSGVAGPTGSLRLEGNILQDESGQRFVMAGATSYLIPFYPEEDGGPDPGLAEHASRTFDTRDAAFANMRALGMNTLRVPLSLTGWVDDPYGLGGPEGYLDRLDSILDSAHAADLAVVLGWWVQRPTPQSAAAQSLAEQTSAVADLIEDRPWVVVEPINEPTDETWEEWTANTKALILHWRRSLDYQGVLILDTPDWSWTFSPDRARQVMQFDTEVRGDASQVVFANHRYANGNACFCGAEREEWDEQVLAWVGEFPIVGTEYGWANTPFPTNRRWNEEFLRHLADRAVGEGFNGALAFVWSWVDLNTMTESDGLTINENGKQYVQDFIEPLVVSGQVTR